MMIAKPLTLLVAVAVGAGGPARRDHKTPHATAFGQATVLLERPALSGEWRDVAVSEDGELKVRLVPGHYRVQAIANDEPGQSPQPPCGEPDIVVIRPREKSLKVTLYCQMK
jgi:hypothetical protein